MTDHPLTRQGGICPLCEGPKDGGLLTCWRCYDQWGLRYGYPEADPVINGFEDMLAEEVAESLASQTINLARQIETFTAKLAGYRSKP